MLQITCPKCGGAMKSAINCGPFMSVSGSSQQCPNCKAEVKLDTDRPADFRFSKADNLQFEIDSVQLKTPDKRWDGRGGLNWIYTSNYAVG